MYAANIFISKAIRTTREMITKRISGQQKQPGSFILQAGPLYLSRSYHVAVSICRIYNSLCDECHVEFFRVGCLSLQMSVKSYVSSILVIFCLQRLCVSSLPFFLSRCISRIVLKSPPIIKILTSCVLMYNSRISNISISSLLGPYMLRICVKLS